MAAESTTNPPRDRPTSCQNCSVPCPWPAETPGKRPLCAECAADFQMRRERVIQRVRRQSLSLSTTATASSSASTGSGGGGGGDERSLLHPRAVSFEDRRTARDERTGNYDMYRKGQLESDNRKSWDAGELEYTKRVMDGRLLKPGLFERILRKRPGY